MQDEHRKAIQNNFGSLVEQTDLDSLVSALYEKGVFSEAMIEPYRDTTRKPRDRKRQLFRDIERRGPTAFANLLDVLTENGNWTLVRALDPSSHLHPRDRRPMAPSMPVNPQTFVSLSNIKKKENLKPEALKNQQSTSPPSQGPPIPPGDDNLHEIPNFHVVKSKKFHEESRGISLYPTHSRSRGVLIAFSFIEFQHNIEETRKGAEVDRVNLKYLFDEIGFRTVLYNNLTKDEMESTLNQLKNVPYLREVECVFVVVSSHGYGREHNSDTEIRCSDGKLISAMEILDHFNNKNFHQLKDKPKVFVFQTCRGSSGEYILSPPSPMEMPGLRSSFDGASAFISSRDTSPKRLASTASSRDTSPSRRASTASSRDASPKRRASYDGRRKDSDCGINRLYSDMLIAHSTLPGFVSRRDPDQGSWYIQALCDVFAANAHDCHVDQLFVMVDIELQKRFKAQTSSVDKWGFNKWLYLHPGLWIDEPERDPNSKSPKYAD